jgi:hypothetical protein
MRFMMLVKASKLSESGALPEEKALAAMARYNEELVKAGVMLDGNGLKASSQGARVRYADGKVTITDGPFSETKELVAGYWILDVKSRDEALAWARRIPFADAAVDGAFEVELRPMFELSDFEQGPAIEHHRRLQQEIKR